MSILVLKPGLLDTLQDLGRYGYSSLGINPGGALDRHAAQVANLLVGNNIHEAVLEIHFPGPQLLFEEASLISICGGDFSPMLDNEPIPIWQPIIVRRNTALHFDKKRSGGVCYLSLHGGFEIDKWLKSYGTHLKAGAGGFKGRKLEKLDRLFQGDSSLYFPGWLENENEKTVLNWRADVHKVYEHPHEILITPGNEWPLVTEVSQKDLVVGNYIIRPSSDRMGYELKGEPIQLKEKVELISSGVTFGTIQLLPNGQLVVLMADHQTTGGYPRIGNVITAHLPKLAQLSPSDCIKFSLTSIEYAEELLFRQRTDLQILHRSCVDHLKQLVC